MSGLVAAVAGDVTGFAVGDAVYSMVRFPAGLFGEHVAVRWEEAGKRFSAWEKVVNVEPVGLIGVQHITVGDKCFWTGEKRARISFTTI